MMINLSLSPKRHIPFCLKIYGISQIYIFQMAACEQTNTDFAYILLFQYLKQLWMQLLINKNQKSFSIDKLSVLKTLNISKETKIYRHSWKQRAKISITAKFEEEIL